jgi:hypothetical protein
MKKILLILVCGLAFSCQDNSEKNIYAETLDSIGAAEIKASAERTAIIAIYDKIEPKTWEDVKNPSNKIIADISTGYDLILFSNALDSNTNYYIRQVEKYKDSSVIYTTGIDTSKKYNWIFKSIADKKATWTVFDLQTKVHHSIGTFKGIDEN